MWFVVKHWSGQLFIAVDQLLNVIVTPFSVSAWADETLSSRAYRAWLDGKLFGLIFMPLIDLLFAWQSIRPDAIGHCHQAFLKERERVGLPPEMRDEHEA